MGFFRRADYQSDATQFINQLKKDRPHLEEGQRAGRALLWDKPQSSEHAQQFAASRVAQKPYVYQTEH
jgi:Protein of unknown function (DUF3460)